MLKLLIRALLWIKARPSSRSIQVGATFSYAKYPEKCFTQICTDLYGDAMLVPIRTGGNQQRHQSSRAEFCYELKT